MENKKLTKHTISVVASLLIATNLYSTEQLSTVTVTSSLIETTEKDATYTTEIYTKQDIEKSKSKDVYDFLNSQTSVTINPSYGNTFTQLIDLRGYGIGSGFQNVVVSVNGRKLNNIDLAPQLLSSISLESIDKIEIIKGSGSVQFGDGANAGVINIITNGKNQNYIKTYLGNNGTKNGTVSLGYSNDNLILNAFLDYTSTNGTRATSDGSKDEKRNKNKNINLIYFPTDDLELRIGRTYSNMDIKYAGSLSLDEYKANPNQSSGFTEQIFKSYVTDVGATYNISNNYSFDLNFSDENKLSEYSSGFSSIYDYKSFNSKFNIKQDNYKVAIGVDGFNGDRIGSSDTTTKENKALFVSGEYNLTNDITLSAGARKEKVEYTYSPDSGTELEDKLNLNAYDIGINYKLNENSSIFANYNRAYQAPDIDRFFASTYVLSGGSYIKTTTFNGFIEPAKVNNFNLGYTNIQKNNKLKINLFASKLRNEIYYYKVGFTNRNTNIDKSYKYGLELFDKYLINDNLYASLNYSYIIAKIDEENESDGAYNGKDLPGVSKHNVTLNLGYNINNFKTVLSHTYRSSAYAANDFENDFSQKQEAYHSTDLSLSYDYKNFEFFAKVQNLFDEDNALWIRDDAVYPTNFERTYYAGLKVKF
ncbi:TonB-dependent receptor [Arcobacter sp. LA11]|uniref:TonB-dependent receptor n=1 Tax=Arcobacter sp. LA11 TaxID=1898176 RepID=UPI000932CEFD|nr:TonB-dependent receptor [Arcobacter sp. LA11]